MLPNEQFEQYGRVLTGEETDLELAQLARVQYLKTAKLRPPLAYEIGDTPDNIADLTRTQVAFYGVSRGIITDPALVARLDNIAVALLYGYGGAEKAVSAIEENNAVLLEQTAAYFHAKKRIMESTDVDEIRMIDLN